MAQKTFAEMDPTQKKIYIVVVLVFVIFGLTMCGYVAFKKDKPAAKSNLSATGEATSEAMVGQDVTWTATVINNGANIASLEANTNFGGMDLISVDPPPVDQPISDVQRFGALAAGQSKTITYHLLAKQTGVANGMIAFGSQGETPDKTLSPQTIVR